MATTFGDIETRARKAVGDTQSGTNLTAANIVSRAREIVNDQTSGSYRFADATMLQYVWDGIRELANFRPLTGTITGSGSGALPVNDRWGGCLENYVAFRCYQIDDSDTANAKLAADSFALFTSLARQTPHRVEQQDMLGYVWEGVQRLWSTRPESRYVGLSLVSWAPPADGSFSAAEAMPTDMRWDGAVVEYVCFKYYLRDAKNGESARHAARHLELFTNWSAQ